MQRNWPYKITGTGVVSAAGVGVSATKANLLAGAEIKSDLLPTDQAFFKLDIQQDWYLMFDLPQKVPVPNLLALLAAREALAAAGLEDLKALRVGVSLGSTVGCSNHNTEFSRQFNSGLLPDPEPVFGHGKYNASMFLASYLGCNGPVQMISNACTSGADAIATGASWLEADLCDLVICGGTEIIFPQIFYGFRSLLLCSPKLCQPFDCERQGLTLGEGAGIVILEKSSSPRRAQALLLGHGSSSDAYHPTAPHPEARGLNLAVHKALKMARKTFDEIDFINAHGTGTSHNDAAEGRWIMRSLPQARVVATKGYTGHTLAAAGAIEAIFTILSLKEQKLPGSLGFKNFDPEIGVTPTTIIESGNYQTALSTSLGFGGTNSALCLGRAP